MRYFSVLLFLTLSIGLRAQSTIQSIPNQKLINGSYVSNPNAILNAETVTQLDTLLTALEKKTTAQVAVVVVQSIGEADIFEFSQKLFDTWGIGSKGNDNGLLVLFVNDQHKVWFNTGYGLEGMLPDITCKRIQRDFMVPEFKNGNYNAGMLAGLQEVSKILTDPKYAEEIKAPEAAEVSDWVAFIIFLAMFVLPVLLIIFFIRWRNGRFADSKEPEETPYPEMRVSRWAWIIEFIGIPIAIITLLGTSGNENPSALCFFLLYLYYGATLLHRLWRERKVINRLLKTEAFYEITEFIRKQQWYWLGMAFLFPFPFFIYFFIHLSRKKAYRNRPRKCKTCQSTMRKLSEGEEDEYLSKEMQMEETLKSVDYDVWKCTKCDGLDMSFYLNRNSKFESCPKCKTIAYYSSGRTTVERATYSSSGKGEEVHTCKFCGHTHKSTYTISRLERTTTTSSSSSSFGSSSSSSGGSWGGGRSGGGGAGSSW